METVTCDGTCTVVLSVQPAPASAEHIADYNEVYAGFFAACILIWLLRRIDKLFSSDYER